MADIHEMDLEEGMHEIDPTPEVDIEAEAPGYNEKRPTLSRSTTNALGISHSSTIYYLTAVQRYSSYVFSAFGVMHIVNTSIMPLVTQSVPASEKYMLLTRPYYGSPLAEPLIVLIPMWAHVLSGLALRIYKRNLNARRYGESYSKENQKSFLVKFWPHLSTVSKLGYQFVPLIVGHMVINRVIPKLYNGSAIDLGYVSHAFAKHPAVSYAGFAALIGIGTFHITWGWAKWLKFTPIQATGTGAERESRKKRRRYIINGVAAAVAGLWMAGSFGIVAKGGAAPGWIGKQYDEMYKMIPVVGNWI
jgi:hypothetical protein